MTKPNIQSLTDKALSAFWEVIVKRYPQAKSGDLSPGATITLTNAAENAISEWIDNNVSADTNE